MKAATLSAKLADGRGRMVSHGRAWCQRGFSLVELMVALAVGLVVVGALLSTLLATSVSSRHSQALTQMSQDASTALGMLREQLAQVGYGNPTSINGLGKFVKAYPGGVPGFVGGGLAGCDTAFADPTLVTIDGLSCAAAGGPAVAVAYEADANSGVATAAGVPLDCLGNGVGPQKVGTNGNYYLVYNRFYLDTPAGAAHKALYCLGNGAPGAQALVENIEDMQIQYGVTTTPGVWPVQANYYVPAVTLNPGGAAPLTPAYTNVVSVRVCVVVGSTEAVMDKNAGNWPQYRGCQNNALVQPLDGRMYRAFTSTVVLQNALAF